MKADELQTPRFICRVARTWSALFGAGAESRHAQTCAFCRQFFQASDELDRRLQRAAADQRCAAPSGLEQRIAYAVRQEQPVPHRNRPRAAIALLAGASACAALALFFVHRQAATAPAVAASQLTPPSAAEVIAVARALPDQLWSSLETPAAELARRDPLQGELDSVYSDARSALTFLADNFLPTQNHGEQPGNHAPAGNG